MLKPLPISAWTDELSFIAGELEGPLNIFGVLANHPQLLKSWWPFRTHVHNGTSLPPALKELVILGTACLWGSDYEWKHHVRRGMDVGLTEQDMKAIISGPDSDHWSESRRVILRLVVDLRMDGNLSETTQKDLLRHYSQQQVLDMIFTVGMYVTQSFVLQSFNVPLEFDPE